ncbi:GIY-YIG nuclease family protein [Bacillus paranthracis]
MNEKGCKLKKIQEYFNTQEKIGYSIFVQSYLHQPVYSENKAEWEQFDTSQFPSVQQALEDIKRVEGILIETYRMRHNDLPPWNKIGGEIAGQKVATGGNYIFIESLTKQNFSPFTAKHTLREISESATYLAFEEFLHSVRMNMLVGISFDNALNNIKRFEKFTYDRIIEAGYLNHELSF